MNLMLNTQPITNKDMLSSATQQSMFNSAERNRTQLKNNKGGCSSSRYRYDSREEDDEDDDEQLNDDSSYFNTNNNNKKLFINGLHNHSAD